MGVLSLVQVFRSHGDALALMKTGTSRYRAPQNVAKQLLFGVDAKLI
jgi:hypothetical protein